MDLVLKNTLPTKILKDAIGNEKLELIRSGLMNKMHYTCQCCGWEGGKEIENRRHLTIQIDQFNEENPIESGVFLVCKSCYLINHIESSVEYGYINFVNSAYSQVDLIKISWSDCSKKTINNNNREKAINDKKIIPLNKSKEYYLNQIKEGKQSDKLKVLFTDKFLTS